MGYKMKKIKYYFLAFAIAFTATGTSLSAIDLSEEQIATIIGSTFEVVLKKPVDDPVKYEKELPLHLLPFNFRNDEYYSIGSAFLTQDGRFISAAHVVGIGDASQNEEISLRDTQGNIYPIDTVYKYSAARDFVVFSIKGDPKQKGLEVNEDFKLNQKIYAVGNALGEGVVIRDGLLTSSTMEEVEGEWKWLRFSAAASPGNSGGPLVDKNGKVIGVILRKSENENLNYALPLKEISSSPETATYNTTAIYKLDITDHSYEFKYDISIDLPLPIAEIDQKMQDEILAATREAAKEFTNTHKETMFPNGEGSLPILYNRYVFFFPGIIARGNDEIWNIYKPENIQSVDTENNGRIDFGQMGNFFYIRMKRPDNIEPQDYYGDSQVFMDNLLEGLPYERQVGVEKIRINSIGKASEERNHTDTYGRKWIVRKYQIAFEDRQMITYSLPTPDGYIVMMSYDNTAYTDFMEIDIKMIIENLYLTYYGTIEQWNYFLSRKDLIPEFAKNITFKTDYESHIQYEDQNFSFHVKRSEMNISKDSDFQIRCAYVKRGDKVTWEPISIAIGESKDSSDYVAVTQTIRPPKDMPQQYVGRWEKVSGKIHPYNGKAYYDNDNQMTHLSLVMGESPLTSKDVIFVVTWHQYGNIANKKMKNKAKALSENLVTKEQ